MGYKIWNLQNSCSKIRTKMLENAVSFSLKLILLLHTIFLTSMNMFSVLALCVVLLCDIYLHRYLNRWGIYFIFFRVRESISLIYNCLLKLRNNFSSENHTNYIFLIFIINMFIPWYMGWCAVLVVPLWSPTLCLRVIKGKKAMWK